MKNQFKEKSYFDEQLKQLKQDITWKEKSKSRLENEILLTIDSRRNRTTVFEGFKYVASVGVMVALLILGFTFLTDNITHQSGESPIGNQGNQTEKNPLTDDKDEQEKDGVEAGEKNLEFHTNSTETVIRKIEGIDEEVKVINYHLPAYGISYQLDESFGSPTVDENQITYSIQNDAYKINLEMMEHANLDKVVSDLVEKFEAEGYDEKFGLVSTPLEENNLNGKMQFYVSPVKGFIAYDIHDHVLVITFQNPEEGGDGMDPLLADLRKSIVVK